MRITKLIFFVGDEEETSEYDNLFASDLGVAIVTEAIRQMAEMRLLFFNYFIFYFDIKVKTYKYKAYRLMFCLLFICALSK